VEQRDYAACLSRGKLSIMRLPAAALILVLASPAASAETIAGRASVIDGDTIDIHGQRIRILDIDAPESQQTCTRPDGADWRCGQEAALRLSDWIGARVVSCAAERKDIYKRWLARCESGGEDLVDQI
jgi:endonuclease YncB( thermonuclease family)